ncbi:MAG: AbrB/MazE/SpoVT family DNA-binding domain-containing protein [Candidatus Bathyarchaeota archaeon]|nr:AbrB/MazE/SpoVT family DNA-binding domain-containing protein [Candidatus Bathyarchaeota archaeon]MDH5791314.1 AbrB/MazE/SpoVT family DNA-binding domain-containing protein [Candidatus Bathyarchaeota archaeon]
MEVSVGSVTSKGQVTIPKEIRDALGLVEGDRIVFMLEGERVVIMKATREKLSDLLTRQKPWPEPGLEFQRRLREEWRSPRS